MNSELFWSRSGAMCPGKGRDIPSESQGHYLSPGRTLRYVLRSTQSVLALRDGSHQAMSAGPASLSPGVLAVGSRGRQSPDGEQLASKTVCQMWPAGLAGSRLSWTEVTNS